MNSTDLIFEEVDRINALPAQGEQSCMVQSDMKAWAVKKGIWLSEHYKNIIVLHAIDRGWLQEYSTGMEIVE